MDDDADEIILFAGFTLLQNLLLSEESEEIKETPYRAPISYEKLESWSISTAGWGDNNCLAYLRFSKAEIMELFDAKIAY